MSDLVQPAKSAYFVRKKPSPAATQPAQAAPAPTSSPAKTTNPLNIPGTKTSLQNSQLLTSIGIPSIDSFIGGGLPVGGVCLVGQDQYNNYADIVTRCFIAEGVAHKHSIYVAKLNEDEKSLFQRIPSSNKSEEPENKKPANNEELRIAWRYGKQDQPQSPQSDAKLLQPNYFVTNKFMTPEEVYSSNIKTFAFNEQDLAESLKHTQINSLYDELADDIELHIDSLNLNITKTKQYTNILRIVVDSMGGLMFNDKCTLKEDESIHLCRFLLYLRDLLRHSLAVCVITVPNEVVANADLMEKFSHLSDYVFVLDDSSQAVNSLKHTQYDGLFRLNKLPRLNSMTQCFMPETLDLAFFMKRKRLVVEQIHLPPDLGDEDEAKGRTSTSVTISCSSAGSKPAKLDF